MLQRASLIIVCTNPRVSSRSLLRWLRWYAPSTAGARRDGFAPGRHIAPLPLPTAPHRCRSASVWPLPPSVMTPSPRRRSASLRALHARYDWFERPSLAKRAGIRLLLHTSMNLGYSCGELHSLAAAAAIWARFPWVVCFSGPDVLAMPSEVSHSHRASHSHLLPSSHSHLLPPPIHTSLGLYRSPSSAACSRAPRPPRRCSTTASAPPSTTRAASTKRGTAFIPPPSSHSHLHRPSQQLS